MNLDPWAYAAKTRSEHAEQVALMMYSSMAFNFGLKAASDPKSYSVQGYAKTFLGECDRVPQLKWLHAISNHGAGFGRAAEGVKAGVADLFLPQPTGFQWQSGPYQCHGLYIELKRQNSVDKKAGKPSEKQLEFQTDMRDAGYAHEICYGWEAARDVILKYLGVA